MYVELLHPILHLLNLTVTIKLTNVIMATWLHFK